MARLVPQDDALGGRVFPIEHGLTIGRESHNDIPLPGNRRASRDHAKVWKDGAQSWAVADLGSTNGTFVNADRITRQALKDGDLIDVGEVVFRFELEAEDRPKAPERPAGKAPDLAAVLRGEASPRPVAGRAAAGETADSIQVQQRVLHYHKKSAQGSQLGHDLGQMAGLGKWLLVLVALGVAVGAFLLAKGVAVQTRTPTDEPPPIESE